MILDLGHLIGSPFHTTASEEAPSKPIRGRSTGEHRGVAVPWKVWRKHPAGTPLGGLWQHVHSAATYQEADEHGRVRYPGKYRVCRTGDDPSGRSIDPLRDHEFWVKLQEEPYKQTAPQLKVQPIELPPLRTWPAKFYTPSYDRHVSVDLPAVARAHTEFFKFGALAEHGRAMPCMTHSNSVVDYRTASAVLPAPVFFNHMPDRCVGAVLALQATDSVIACGILWNREAISWARAMGHKANVSIGWGVPMLNGEEQLGSGRNAVVNGYLVHGPVTIIRGAAFRELSLTEAGADTSSFFDLDREPMTKCIDLSSRSIWIHKP